MIVETLTLTLLSMASVGLWTLRVTMAAGDRRAIAAAVAATEALVFALSFSQILTNLDQIHRIAGYSTGVALGTYIGLCVTQYLPTTRPAVSNIDQVTPDRPCEPVAASREMPHRLGRDSHGSASPLGTATLRCLTTRPPAKGAISTSRSKSSWSRPIG